MITTERATWRVSRSSPNRSGNFGKTIAQSGRADDSYR
jgi:hypothetical protein